MNAIDLFLGLRQMHRQPAIVILFGEGTYRGVDLEGGVGGRDPDFERFGQRWANVVDVQRSALGAIDENRLASLWNQKSLSWMSAPAVEARRHRVTMVSQCDVLFICKLQILLFLSWSVPLSKTARH